MEKVKHLHGELEDNKKIIEIYKEDITEYEKVADTLDKELAEMVEEAIHLKNIKVGIKERLNRQRKEFKVLKSQKDGKARAKGNIEKKRDELIITIENVHEICAYGRHTNIDNLRREIKQTVDEYIEYCEKCDEPKYGCNCELNKA
jgi:chromosome segregation ATPase